MRHEQRYTDYSTPALFRDLTNVAGLHSAGVASLQITFTNKLQQDASKLHSLIVSFQLHRTKETTQQGTKQQV